LDTITDFGLSDGDLLVLDTSIYAALSYPSTHDPQNKLSMNHSHEASLLQSEFLSGAGVSAAQSASQKILFNSTNGYLYYDADGSGASSTAIHFATIQNSGAAVAMTYDKIRLI
jgi:Ca2+-binding RTX toxin-like protein